MLLAGWPRATARVNPTSPSPIRRHRSCVGEGRAGAQGSAPPRWAGIVCPRRTGWAGRWAALVLALSPACRDGGPGSRPAYLLIQVTLAEGIAEAEVAALEVLLAPVPGMEAPSFTAGTALSEVSGTPVLARTVDEDGDGRAELLVSYAQSPLRGRVADLYLCPVVAGTRDRGLTAESPPLTAQVRLYDRDGQRFATGEADFDAEGDRIRLGVRDRRVRVLVSCRSDSGCARGVAPLPPSQGAVRARVLRARDCPADRWEGDLYLFLVARTPSALSGASASSVRPGVDFGDEAATARVELPPPCAPAPTWRSRSSTWAPISPRPATPRAPAT
jgi:hypothetical protein